MLHVIVDIDDTILTAQEGSNARTSAVMFRRIYGVNAHEDMIENKGKTELGIIREVLDHVTPRGITPEHEPRFFAVPKEAHEIWTQAAIQEFKERPPKVHPGIPELLSSLSQNPDIRLQLLSGNSTTRAEAKLVAASLDSFFRKPETGTLMGVFGEMAPRRSQLFEILKNQLPSGDQVLIIDDSLIGAEMARDFSIPIVLVATGTATVDQLRKFSPHVYPDFGENRWKEVGSIISKMAS